MDEQQMRDFLKPPKVSLKKLYDKIKDTLELAECGCPTSVNAEGIILILSIEEAEKIMDLLIAKANREGTW